MTSFQMNLDSTRQVMAAAVFAAIMTVACSSDGASESSTANEPGSATDGSVSATETIGETLATYITEHPNRSENENFTSLRLRVVEGDPERDASGIPDDAETTGSLIGWVQDDGSLQYTLNVHPAEGSTPCSGFSAGLFREDSDSTARFQFGQRPTRGGTDYAGMGCDPGTEPTPIGFDYLFTELQIAFEADTITFTTLDGKTVVFETVAPPPPPDTTTTHAPTTTIPEEPQPD